MQEKAILFKDMGNFYGTIMEMKNHEFRQGVKACY